MSYKYAVAVSLFSSLCFFDCGGSTFQGTDGAPPVDTKPTVDRPPGQYDIKIAPPVKISLGTFNVHNFFDDQDDPKHADDIHTASQVASKIKILGKAIRLLNVDVLALQEVENKQLLDQLNSQELGSMNYKHVRLFEGNDIRGIDVAVLSRFPIPKAKSHKGDRFLGVDGDTKTYGFSRDCLEVTIEGASGRTMILLINHLRATDWKDPKAAEDRRKAQAKQVRKIADNVLKWHPNANLAVLGDLNDTPGSPTLDLIQKGTPFLSDLTTLVSTSQRYTTFYQSKKTQLDYILVSPGLKADLTAGSVLIDHSTTMKNASDHYPIRVRFTLN